MDALPPALRGRPEAPALRLPPHAPEAERAVLGAVLLEAGAFHRVSDLLRPEVFYKPAHAVIYEAVESLSATLQPIDLITVVDQLRDMGRLEACGGPAYLADLTAAVAGSGNLEFHARLLCEKHAQRALIGTCSEFQAKAYDDTNDVFELLDAAEQALFTLSAGRQRRGSKPIQALLPQALLDMERRAAGAGLRGISTGFRQLDILTAGWQPSDLVVVAARPAMGKTAFMLAQARHAAVEQGVPVLIFSLEMSEQQLAERLAVAEARVDAQRARSGQLHPHEYEDLLNQTNRLARAPLFINDTAGLTLAEMRSECRRMKAEHGIRVVMLDYLQLMSPGTKPGTSREQEVAALSRGLKALAKETGVTVIALSQLSRRTEERATRRPLLSDLRESGAIEQDADVVMFLFRPEYYGITEDEQGLSTEGVCEAIIGKQRNGPVGTAFLRFTPRTGRFEEPEPGVS